MMKKSSSRSNSILSENGRRNHDCRSSLVTTVAITRKQHYCLALLFLILLLSYSNYNSLQSSYFCYSFVIRPSSITLDRSSNVRSIEEVEGIQQQYSIQRYPKSQYSSPKRFDNIIKLFGNNDNNNNNELLSAMPAPARLRQLLDRVATKQDSILLLPCCYDGLTARLVARGGFQATFMTGFGVSAVNGYPDTQLVSYQEMVTAANTVSEALSSVALERHSPAIPCIADGDTGYGNAVNVKRTVFGYARAGMAGIMIEDQVSPKRCGHVSGKSVIPFDDAVARVKAACDARDEYESLFGVGTGPLILARTDALKTNGFDNAIQRCLAFKEQAGCDITFLEAPESIEQMQQYCSSVPGYKLANMLEQGSTPILPPSELQAMGYTIAAYPLTLLSASIKAMEESLSRIQHGIPTDDIISSFTSTKDVVGFTQYSKEENRYKVD